MTRKSSRPGGRSRSARSDWQQAIATERISILFNLADSEFGRHPARSDRYVELARKIGMRYNVKIPHELKRRFCNECHCYLRPGKNCIVRSNSKLQAVQVKCQACGHVNRYPYAREKAVFKARRRNNN